MALSLTAARQMIPSIARGSWRDLSHFLQAILDGDFTSLIPGVTATAAELNVLDGATATTAEINTVAGVTAGAVAASKAVVVNATADASGFRNLGLTGTLTFGVGGAIDADSGTASATAGAATLNKMAGKITTEALTTAQNAAYTLTLTNSAIAAADMVFVTIANGTNTQGTPVVLRVTPAAGSVAIVIGNRHDAAQALNGTLVVSFLVVKA